jgi:hypothetical protein
MQVKVLISDVLRLQCALSYGRAFLDHDAVGVNDFLVQAGAAIDDYLIPAQVCVSMAPRCDNTGRRR